MIVSADYSQLELRIIAHLSNDTKLVQTLNSGTDVFRNIASQICRVHVTKVTDTQRQQAKQVSISIRGKLVTDADVICEGKERKAHSIHEKVYFQKKTWLSVRSGNASLDAFTLNEVNDLIHFSYIRIALYSRCSVILSFLYHCEYCIGFDLFRCAMVWCMV